jgi:hypothetical protein
MPDLSEMFPIPEPENRGIAATLGLDVEFARLIQLEGIVNSHEVFKRLSPGGSNAYYDRLVTPLASQLAANVVKTTGIVLVPLNKWAFRKTWKRAGQTVIVATDMPLNPRDYLASEFPPGWESYLEFGDSWRGLLPLSTMGFCRGDYLGGVLLAARQAVDAEWLEFQHLESARRLVKCLPFSIIPAPALEDPDDD